MTREQIENAAGGYSSSVLGFKDNPVVMAKHKAFMVGAEWRINSVWHEVRKKPDKGKLLIVEDIDSAYELVYLTNSKPWEELSKKNHYMHWAYVADLLPDRKEEER